MIDKLKVIALLLALPITAQAKSEDDYNRPWCESIGGAAEFYLLDRTRVDCITDTHAYEADFARKWYEGVGQALHYGRMTGMNPGLMLIVEHEKDYRYVTAALLTIGHWKLPIDVVIVSR